MKDITKQNNASFFFGLISTSKNIQRWSLLPQFKVEFLAEHCFETAVIGHLLGAIAHDVFGETVCPDRVAVLCLYHDAGESSGLADPPSVAKNIDQETKRLYKLLEHRFEALLLDTLPNTLKERYTPLLHQNKGERHGQLCKYADQLSAYNKCDFEIKKGNTAFQMAFNNIQKEIEHLRESDEVFDYYCEHFLDLSNMPFDHVAKLNQPQDT